MYLSAWKNSSWLPDFTWQLDYFADKKAEKRALKIFNQAEMQTKFFSQGVNEAIIRNFRFKEISVKKE